ncbi:MAG: hypothetical protein JWQ73_271 [Variovorax sp.]|jgi:hypothetical protein|nr:hypothetical protein [Variovorax sp.]
MKALRGYLSGAMAAAVLAVGAQAGQEQDSSTAGEQQEADYRVIAARCGTPAFEHAFFRQSAAFVSAGQLSRGRRPADVEKSITALRRSPFVLVATNADCPARLAELTALQKSRSFLIKTPRPMAKSAR